MRPELPTNIESLLLQPRRDGGGFSLSKQQDISQNFASLLGAGTRTGTADDGLPVALPMLPAGEILPPGGKSLPERRVPPTDARAVPAPVAETAVDTEAGTASGPLALMLDAGGADLAPRGKPLPLRIDTDGAPESMPADAAAVVPAVTPTSVTSLTDSIDAADVSTNVAARAVPVAAPPLTQDASRATGPAKRVTPPIASTSSQPSTRSLITVQMNWPMHSVDTIISVGVRGSRLTTQAPNGAPTATTGAAASQL